MLYYFFERILSMGFTASAVILAVLAVRAAMCRLPKKYVYLLWIIVGVRLVCPIAISSPVSLYNLLGQDIGGKLQAATDAASQGTAGAGLQGWDRAGMKQQGQDDVSNLPGGMGQSSQESQRILSVDGASKPGTAKGEQAHPLIRYGSMIWLGGMAGILLWNAFAICRIRKSLETAVRRQGNVYECDNIPSPFVMGMIRPRIYIPFRLEEQEREYILAHERRHVKRRDYLVKFFAFLLVCVYWFHPLVWLSYFLLARDMEMSCDEYVLQNMPEDIRASYSRSLLGFALNRRGMAAGLLTFGETNARKRVKNVLRFRKPKKWTGIAAAALLAVTGIVCLTNARGNRVAATKGAVGDGKGQAKEQEHSAAGASEDEKQNAAKSGVVADGEAHGYQVKVVYLPEGGLPEKAELEAGMYQGDFAIQTYKEDRLCAQCQMPGEQPLYYPAEGFELVMEDYDGDGSMDDFALGQGQTPLPQMGNYMYYWFYAVEEDGSIVQYELSTKDGKSLVTLPDAHSRAFDVDGGKLRYLALGEEGVEEATAVLSKTVSSQDPYRFYFQSLDVTICLPENKHWIQKPKTSMDGDVGVVDYHDGIIGTDVTLRFGKGDKKHISGDFSDDVDGIYELWSYFAGSEERSIRVWLSSLKNSVTTVVLSWEYNGVSFFMHADFNDKAHLTGKAAASDWTSLAKTAAYIAEKWYSVLEESGSNTYLGQEIESAKKCVERFFKKTFHGCEIKKIWYDEQRYRSQAASWIQRYKSDYVMILYCDFYVSASGGDGSLERDSTYTDFMWVLTRNENSDWKVQTYGY